MVASIATGLPASAQVSVLNNNGATIVISNGAFLNVGGGLTNNVGSTLTNNGNIAATGDITNNASMSVPNSGLLIFSGNSIQNLNGSATYFAKDVMLNNNTSVNLNAPLKVDGTFNFINGILTAPTTTNAVTFTSNASVSINSAPSNNSHIQGYVVKEGTGSFTFPIGDANHYQPVRVNLSSNASGVQAQYVVGNAGAASFGTTGASSTPLVAYNGKEYWNLSPLSTAAGTVTINWDNYMNNGISNVADLKVAHKSGSSWLNEGGSGLGTPAAGSITSLSVSTWSPFTLGSSSPSSPLPLELLSFSGNRISGTNHLQWHAVNEQSLQSYILQRSFDGIAFADLRTIAVKGGTDNTYSYAEAWNNIPYMYYRLKLIGSDGAYSNSNMVRIAGESLSGQGSLIPNPAHQSFTLTAMNAALLHSIVSIVDVSGQKVRSWELSSLYEKVDVSNFASGIYFLQFADGSVLRFVKE